MTSITIFYIAQVAWERLVACEDRKNIASYGKKGIGSANLNIVPLVLVCGHRKTTNRFLSIDTFNV